MVLIPLLFTDEGDSQRRHGDARRAITPVLSDAASAIRDRCPAGIATSID
jgi:hypothetical protein